MMIKRPFVVVNSKSTDRQREEEKELTRIAELVKLLNVCKKKKKNE
jgi:hypothetical protein